MTHIRQRIAVVFAWIMMVMMSPASLASPSVTSAEPAAKSAQVTAATKLPGTQVNGTVNINTADAETLAKSLNGIGTSKAEAIVEYRNANGPFATVEDLINVKGIGAATVEKNAAIIAVE